MTFTSICTRCKSYSCLGMWQITVLQFLKKGKKLVRLKVCPIWILEYSLSVLWSNKVWSMGTSFWELIRIWDIYSEIEEDYYPLVTDICIFQALFSALKRLNSLPATLEQSTFCWIWEICIILFLCDVPSASRVTPEDRLAPRSEICRLVTLVQTWRSLSPNSYSR